MDADVSLRSAFSSMFQNRPLTMGGGDAGAKARQFETSFAAGLNSVIPEMIAGEVQIYAQVFTAQELRDAAAFYRTPSGHAFMTKLPMVMREARPLSASMMPKIFAAAEVDYCRRNNCSESDRALFQRLQTMLSRMGAAAAQESE